MELLRTQSMIWLERTNPLRGLSISRASSIFDLARVWGSPRLQYMYNEIEATDPVLMTCVERRASALAGLQRQFVAISGADPSLAEEQRDALIRFSTDIENFDEALERMDEAFFRGYCHMQPIWEGNGVRHINFLNSWNFMRDRQGAWLWNPKCHETIDGLDYIKNARLVSLVRRRAIDYPAIFIYIRKALGERDYGKFIERHGIPHAAIIMAPNTEEKHVKKYVDSADAWNNGQDIALPNGSDIKLATEARGTDPFTPFVEHQDKYVVLLATGGTLTSLAQADTGSLAGGAQMEVWREIVARDGVLIADAFNRGLFRRYLELAFPGKPIAAEFRLSNEKQSTPADVADLAGKLKVAGYTIDKRELEEAVGFTLSPVPEAQPQMPGFMQNKEEEVVEDSGSGRKDDQLHSTTTTHDYNSSMLSSFAADNAKLADAINLFLKNPTPEDAQDLIDALPDLVPDDPALAAVIAEEMAKEMGCEMKNVIDANGMEHADGGEGGGQFVKQGEGATVESAEQKIEHKPAAPEQVAKFLKELPDKITPQEFDELLTAGFSDIDGDGNTVNYGTLLRDHWQDGNHSSNDINARKTKLGTVVRLVRGISPMQSKNPSKPNEKVYFGLVGKKAWVAIADEHNEIGAMEMVSYRRDGRNDKRQRA